MVAGCLVSGLLFLVAGVFPGLGVITALQLHSPFMRESLVIVLVVLISIGIGWVVPQPTA